MQFGLEKTELKIKRVPHDGVPQFPPLPTQGTPGAAGHDLYAAIPKPVEIEPGGLVRIPTGVAIALPSPDTVGLVFARSGLGVKHGICLSNGVGVIDSDYRGELIVGLCNVSNKTYTIEPGERIAQLAVLPVIPVALKEVEELDETERSDGGFGSTGRY